MAKLVLKKDKAKRIDYHCAHCGSRDLKHDAYVAWNTARQDWDVVMVADKPVVCEQCGGETTAKEIELDPV